MSEKLGMGPYMQSALSQPADMAQQQYLAGVAMGANDLQFRQLAGYLPRLPLTDDEKAQVIRLVQAVMQRLPDGYVF